MTLAVTKTKAEQALSHNFEAVAAKLPGNAGVAAARKAAIGAFASLGLPHRRIEEWKYTDLRSALKEALPPSVGEAGAFADAHEGTVGHEGGIERDHGFEAGSAGGDGNIARLAQAGSQRDCLETLGAGKR